MAELMRLSLSRPWLLASVRSRTPTTPPILYSLSRSISTTTLRPYAAKGGGSKRSRFSQSRSSGNNKNVEMKKMEANMTLLLPMTLVAPPIWRYPREPTKFLDMLWTHLKTRLQTMWALASMKMISQPRIIFSKPKFQFGKAAVVPTAKALHVAMSEAMAVGDKETLRSICTPELFQTLAAAIDGRPPGTRAEWELVRYEHRWWYPRLADWRVGYQPMSNNDMKLLKQAVVSIASVQRIARYDFAKGGVKIAGSERVRHMTEHLVLQSQMDKQTYEAQPWKIWGTLPESTYETYKSDVENLQALMNDQIGKT